MQRKSIDDLGDLQKEVMEIVWELGDVTVNDVRDRIAEKRELAYTTVLSVMQKLEKAGWVKHRKDGRMYLYSALHSREQEGQRAVKNFVRNVFYGNPMMAFQHLLQDSDLSESELNELKKMIEQRKES